MARVDLNKDSVIDAEGVFVIRTGTRLFFVRGEKLYFTSLRRPLVGRCSVAEDFSVKLRLLLCCAGLCLMLSGCGGTSAETVQAVSTDPPASWSADDRIWQYQASMNQADEELLTKFFRINTSVQGSSDFEGPPVMMVAGKSDRRFYWRRGSFNSLTWSCIHFEGGKFRTSEGSGDPFSP